jgi:hypothetical protein
MIQPYIRSSITGTNLKITAITATYIANVVLAYSGAYNVCKNGRLNNTALVTFLHTALALQLVGLDIQLHSCVFQCLEKPSTHHATYFFLFVKHSSPCTYCNVNTEDENAPLDPL